MKHDNKSHASRSPNKRSDRSRQAILASAFAAFVEVGLDKLTIEGVAARAGVGKATIYRWWPSKGALVVEAFLNEIEASIEFPRTDSATADITAQMLRLAQAYRGDMGRFVCEMIGAGQFDADTMQLFFNGYLLPRRQAARSALKRGVDTGELRPDVEFDAVIDALYAPLFHRLLIGHAENSEAFVTFIAETVLAGISAHKA